ncbi:MAG: signal recognition particle-docking protein FtsY [Calditrichia bacterium]
MAPSFFNKFKNGLKRTRESVFGQFINSISGKSNIDEHVLEEVEEMLVMGDVGISTTSAIIADIRKEFKNKKEISQEDFLELLKAELMNMLPDAEENLNFESKPRVIMVVGVNGTGKTTSIGKLAARYKQNGLDVILGAADTFRAAAIDQLSIWADRVQVDVVKHKEGGDPGAVAFDTVQAAVARNKDVAIIDTAGRLHTKSNLMEELAKIKRVIQKVLPDAPHEIYLVLDATTGQNAVNQAKQFVEKVGVTGIILTKLDGTAKGGVVLGIQKELGIPVKYVGLGEQIDDLQPFNKQDYVEGLFG